MNIRSQQSRCLLTIIIIAGSPIALFPNAYGQKPPDLLDWAIEVPKKALYPGEAVQLTLHIRNRGAQEERVDFGADGIEAFSMEIRDHSDRTLAKGTPIRRFGLARAHTLAVGPGQAADKSIVLNQWCSTLLPAGEYQVTCDVEYRLRSEARKIPDTEHTFEVGPIHRVQLSLGIQLAESDPSKYKDILDALAKHETDRGENDRLEWLRRRDLARELIVFTEWESAVPYQLQVLMTDRHTWLRRDAIASLAKSRSLAAATGLVAIGEDPSFEDVKNDVVEGVYKLRETGKTEIVSATEGFAAKHKRVVPSRGER